MDREESRRAVSMKSLIELLQHIHHVSQRLQTTGHLPGDRGVHLHLREPIRANRPAVVSQMSGDQAHPGQPGGGGRLGRDVNLMPG